MLSGGSRKDLSGFLEQRTSMKVAKLSTGQIVRYLKPPQPVKFADGEHVLISDIISENPNRIHPHWIISTLIVWVLSVPQVKESSK